MYHFPALYKGPSALWDTLQKILLRCGIQRKKKCSGVGYNGKHSSLLDTTEDNSSGKILKLFCGVSTPEENLFHCTHTGKKTLPLYPTTEENLFRCIPQQRKTSSVVSHSGKKLTNLNPCWRKNLSEKNFLLTNQGPRLSTLMKIIEGEKSRGPIPLKNLGSTPAGH